MSLSEGCDAQPTQNDEVIREAQEAAKRLSSDHTWDDWVKVGRAFLIGRAEAMREAKTDRPVGGKYNNAYSQWLEENELAEIDKAVRSRLLYLLDHHDEVERWRSTLPINKRMRLNHPDSVSRAWKAKATATAASRNRQSPFAAMKRSLQDQIEDNDRLRQQVGDAGGLFWSRDADKLAQLIVDKLPQPKAVQVARAVLRLIEDDGLEPPEFLDRRAAAGAAVNEVSNRHPGAGSYDGDRHYLPK